MCAFVTNAPMGATTFLNRTGNGFVCVRVQGGIGPAVQTGLISSRRVRVPRMGLGEDGLVEDLEFARGCIEGGCEIDAVQGVLTRLEQRRAVLALELDEIEEVMATLAKENLGGDRSLVAQAMEAAVRIFSKVEDNYPKTGTPAGYTMDPLRKQPKF